jgi:ABC-2 type transport system permease protein
LLLIYYLVVGRFLGASRAIENFAIFVYAGLAVWNLFAEIISFGTTSVLVNGGIVKKIQLPRDIFPLSCLGSALFNFGIQLVVVVVVALFSRTFSFGLDIFAAVAAIAIVVVWGTGLAFILAAANVYLRDIQYLVEVVLMFGFWLSPALYSWDMVRNTLGPALSEVYLLNPVTIAVMGMQKCLWDSGQAYSYPDQLALRLVLALVAGLIVLFIGERCFDRWQRNFAQEI